MKFVNLSEVAEIIAGQSPPSSTYNKTGDGLPFFQGKADFGDLYPSVRIWCSEPKKIAEIGDILISVRAPVGPTNIANTKACIGRGLSAIRTGSKLEKDFLLLYLRSIEKKISNMGKGSTFKAITQKDLQEIKIPLFSIEDQKAIVKSLKVIDTVRKKRNESLEMLDVYINSVFLEMFGDPGKNDRNYEKLPLSEISIKITDGEHATPRRTSSGIKLLSARNVKNGYIDFDAGVDYIPEDEYKRIIKRCNPEFGDILISCSGTIGRVTTVNITEPFTLVRSAALVKPNKERIEAKYLEFYLRSKYLQDLMFKSVNQSSQANLFLGQINKLPVLLPPINEQKRFIDIIHKQEIIKKKMNKQSELLGLQFESFVHNTFATS